MAKKTNTTTGLEFLLSPAPPVGPLVAVTGDDGFLKREVLAALRAAFCDGDDDLDWQAFEGGEAEWRDVADGVSARSLFGGGRPVAAVDDADRFVTRYRDQLEAFVESTAAGVVVLELKSLPGNTRLGKAVAATGGVIACKTPDRGAELSKHRRDAGKWLVARAKSRHEVTLGADAVDALFDLLPMSLGVIDQEVARLSLLAGEARSIDRQLVTDHVGGWRTRTAWELVDAAADGRTADAFGQLDRLLLSGEQPIGVLAQLGSSLRRFSAAAAAIEAGEQRGARTSLQAALRAAGVAPFKLADAERQLRRIGRARARQLTDWVLEADLAMKGHNSRPERARVELERLIARLGDMPRN